MSIFRFPLLLFHASQLIQKPASSRNDLLNLLNQFSGNPCGNHPFIPHHLRPLIVPHAMPHSSKPRNVTSNQSSVASFLMHQRLHKLLSGDPTVNIGISWSPLLFFDLSIFKMHLSRGKTPALTPGNPTSPYHDMISSKWIFHLPSTWHTSHESSARHGLGLPLGRVTRQHWKIRNGLLAIAISTNKGDVDRSNCRLSKPPHDL